MKLKQNIKHAANIEFYKEEIRTKTKPSKGMFSECEEIN